MSTFGRQEFLEILKDVSTFGMSTLRAFQWGVELTLDESTTEYIGSERMEEEVICSLAPTVPALESN